MAPPSPLPDLVERKTSDLLQEAMNLHSRTTLATMDSSAILPSARCLKTLDRRDLSKGGVAGVSIGSVVGLSIVFFIAYPFVARSVRLGWNRWKAKRKVVRDQHQDSSKSDASQDVENNEPETTGNSSTQQELGASLQQPLSRQVSFSSSLDHSSGDESPASQTRALSDISNPEESNPDGNIGSEPPEYIHFTTGLSSTYYSSDVPNSAFGLSNDAEMQDPDEFQKAQDRASTEPENRKSSTLISTIRKIAQGISGSTSDNSVTNSTSRALGDNRVMDRNMTESPTNLGTDSAAISGKNSAIGDRGFVLPPDVVHRKHPRMDAANTLAPVPTTVSETVNPMEIMGMGTLTENERTWRFTHLGTDPQSNADEEVVQALLDAAYANGVELNLSELASGMGAVDTTAGYAGAGAATGEPSCNNSGLSSNLSVKGAENAYALLDHGMSGTTVSPGHSGSLQPTATKANSSIPSTTASVTGTGSAAVHQMHQGIVDSVASHSYYSHPPAHRHTPLDYSHSAGVGTEAPLPTAGNFASTFELPRHDVAVSAAITPSSVNAFPSPISMTTAASQDGPHEDSFNTNSTSNINTNTNTNTQSGTHIHTDTSSSTIAQLQPHFNIATAPLSALTTNDHHSSPQQSHLAPQAQQVQLPPQLQEQQQLSASQISQLQQEVINLDSSNTLQQTARHPQLSVPNQSQPWNQQQQQQQQQQQISVSPGTQNLIPNSNISGFLPSPPQATENQFMDASYSSFYPQPQASYANSGSYPAFIDMSNSAMMSEGMLYQRRMNMPYDQAQHIMAANVPNMPMDSMNVDIDLVEYLPSQPPQYAAHRYTLSNASAEYGADVSDMSTPYHFNSPSAHSVANTPDTRISVTPSPKVNLVHDMTSPYAAMCQSSPIAAALKCDECGRTFNQAHKLNHHKRYHERPHECTHDGCGKRFGTKTHLERHVNDKHKQTRKYHCTEPGCAYSRASGKGFPRKDNWRRHMLNIHGCSPGASIQADVVDESMMNTGA
ncbi:Zinc finger protein 165 [Ceratocystis fimbriata CBS 114723]|uniref:Zinc finger protein 165 n=1 Tax=Ceratocystis fimbriata CBS 114723 TaxID=1035309 RepID=A0A2C5X348_9PEZI|nr:Zinc finger protein 165 [Ceratocystis fimbriata CBS 114723]